MNNIYLFDIDGTLSMNGIIPKSAKVSLSTLRKNGSIVMLSTGRCIGQMKDVLDAIEVDGAILNNGALAILHDEIIFSSSIDKNTILKMHNEGLNVGLLTKDDYVVLKDDRVVDDFFRFFSINKPRVVDLSYVESNDVYSLGLYDYNLDKIDINKYIDLRFVRVCDLGYDVMNKDINKASCITNLKNKYPGYKIISFGDNYNDIEMLEASDISIVMAKTPDEVKTYADYITKDVFEDGIFYALKNYLRVI